MVNFFWVGLVLSVGVLLMLITSPKGEHVEERSPPQVSSINRQDDERVYKKKDDVVLKASDPSDQASSLGLPNGQETTTMFIDHKDGRPKASKDAVARLVKEMNTPEIKQAYSEYLELAASFDAIVSNMNQAGSLREARDIKRRLDEISEEMANLIEAYILERYP